MNFKLLDLASDGFNPGHSQLRLIFVDEVWRAMLGMEFIPAITFLVIILFIPESPRWLVIKNKADKAEQIFSKIYRSPLKGKKKVNEMRVVKKDKKDKNWALLKNPKVIKPILLGVAIAMLGQFMGVNAVLYYGPSIFEKSGLSGGDALFYQVWVGLVNVITTVIALLIIDKIGRKKLIYFGVSGMIITLVLISFYFTFGQDLNINEGFLLVFFLAYVFSTAISISAVIFVLLSEMYPNQIRGIAMSIAGVSLWVGTYLIGQLTPWLLENLNPSGTFLLFAGMCFPYLYLMWRYIPETAGKSLEEIEAYWFSDKN